MSYEPESAQRPSLPSFQQLLVQLRVRRQRDLALLNEHGFGSLNQEPLGIQAARQRDFAVPDASAHGFLSAESQDARKFPPNNGYTSKVRVLDRYKVVGFISSGTYGRVYKAVGVNGQSGEFAIKKCIYPISWHTIAC